MSSTFTESVVEEAALAWLEACGWQMAHGPEIAPGQSPTERAGHGDGMLAERLIRGTGR